MFERFTDEARSVVVEAQAEARELRHSHIGVEHLLLGVLRLPPEGLAAHVLASAGAQAADVRARLRERVAPGERIEGQMPFTPRAKKVLERAMRETLSRGDFHVAPEYILLGILRDDQGLAIALLEERGVTAQQLREALEESLPTPQAHEVQSLPRRLVAAARGRAKAGQLPIEIDVSAEARQLLMSAGARALEEGRTLISIADIEEALRRRGDAEDPPPQAATG
jgi:ATP-dependent Clp protease ATP-binding subunit ClpA